MNVDALSAPAGKITKWATIATGGIPPAITGGHKLDGTPLTNYFTTFFAAPIGEAVMTDPGLRASLNMIYSAVANVSEDYHEDTVTMHCLLVISGNF